ncbi:MAG: rhomboid family intramembrane serine protease [Myxococcota bacterium]|nr:rhomboid family intramembrane serine protease [Myxococcota bacterium]
MFPIRDDNPHFLTPVVTYGLVVVNAAVWFGVQGLGTPQALAASICQLGLVPAELLNRVDTGTYFEMGPMRCVLDPSASWFTPLTSMFLHGGWMHIIGNMWFLHIFGNNVEDSMGHARFLAFYLVCGLAAAALQVAFEPGSEVPMVGASGAIGGVMGAYIVLYPKVRVHLLLIFGFYVTTWAVPASFMLGYWFLLQLIGGAAQIGSAPAGGTAFWAHVGGFAAGMVLIFVFRDPAQVARHPYHGRRAPAAGRAWEHRRGVW